MSKYTTEVRFICEEMARLNFSKGCNDVDEIIKNSWNKIFTTKTEFFEENYRQILCSKILKHYYLREICSETVGIWKLWMNERLENIMPYYNQMYKSQMLEFDPFHDVDLTRTHVGEEQKNENLTRDNKININTSYNSTNINLFSATPQGAITNLENESYLTDARKITDTGSCSNDEVRNEDENINMNRDDKYLETVKGKQGTENYSSLLLKYRETFLNIDNMVIEEFSDLFFGLW